MPFLLKKKIGQMRNKSKNNKFISNFLFFFFKKKKKIWEWEMSTICIKLTKRMWKKKKLLISIWFNYSCGVQKC